MDSVEWYINPTGDGRPIIRVPFGVLYAKGVLISVAWGIGLPPDTKFLGP
jgi:hypothetical protein